MSITSTENTKELRVALIEAFSRRAGEALARSSAKEPVIVVARPRGDALAKSLVRFVGARVEADVAVFAMERATFLRHAGPAVAEDIERMVKASPSDGAKGAWIVVIAYGGATVGAAELQAVATGDA